MFLRKKSQPHNTRLTTLVDELQDGFCTIRLNGDFIYMNRSARNLFAFSDDPYDYNFFRDCIRNEVIINKMKINFVEKDYLKDIEIDLYNTKNQKFPTILTLNLIRDLRGNTIGMAALIKDMTAFKNMQTQLLQAQKMESIGLLASGIAHEFNNILSGIMPNAELIKMTTDKESQNHARAESIEKSAQRAANIVKQLLSFARTDKFDDDVSLDLKQSVTETLEIMGKLFNKNITIENKLPMDLYPVKADPTRVQQIVMNLAINAKDAIKDVSGFISFKAENIIIKENYTENIKLPSGKYVKMIVSDTGGGIPPHVIDKIFDPFFTTKSPGKGTGLGLSTVYGIVKNINGEIKVFSELNKGTRFEIYLPASEKAAVNDETSFEMTVLDEIKTVLVVDDEDMIREMTKDMLNYFGYEVLIAKNGMEALNIFKNQSEKIDIVLLDLIMPKMNGVVCFEKIREIKSDVPVIITSGVGEADKRDDLLRMGVTAYLEKPYTIKVLADKFKEIFKV
ncbi:MAG: response regulator [Calditrichaceae bacterium]